MATERKNLFVLDGGDLYDFMFYDIKNNGNVDFLNFKYDIGNKFLKAINKVHTSIRLSKKVPVPLKGIWFKKSTLYNYQFDLDKEYNLVFTDTSIILLTLSDIRKLQKKVKCNIILLFLNPVSSPGGGVCV